MNYPKLLSPLQLGAIEMPNRVLMAPLTRVRADENHVPTDIMAKHYADRATAGLIIAEATAVSESSSAFGNEPGIFNDAQIEGWKRVTDAVHEKGGRIFLQIWHGGRACHPDFNDGQQPVAPSPFAITNDEVHTPEGKKKYTVPRQLDDDEIPDIIAAFKSAAENAKEAGFDGVEVHGANGYLLDEFLRNSANFRTGDYGGPKENRARLLLEVIDAVCEVWDNDRVGVRVSPFNSFNSMEDSAPEDLYTYLAEQLNEHKLAYLHVMRADFLEKQQGDILPPIRKAYQGTLVSNMGYTAEEAEKDIESKLIDAVAFGTSYLANPDLPERFAADAELNAPNPDTFYSQGEEGYNDYPAMT